MEFNEKLQQLRKSRGLTQEELAEALFVSRAAVSKWESGRGYPALDSLKQLSRFFAVSIDELICPEEMISAAEEEKKESLNGVVSLICGILDAMAGLLLLLPVFGNGKDSPASVSLFALTGVKPWIKAAFIALVALTALNGVCGAVVSRFSRPVWNRHRIVTGMALSLLGTAVFLLTRQPYAGVIYLAVMAAKGLLLLKGKLKP